MKDQNEPKSIGAFIRLTDRLCSHVNILRKSTATTNLISQNLQNPDQFDLENASIEVKTRLLRRFARVMLDTGTNQQKLLKTLIDYIKQELNTVEERQVIDLLHACDLICMTDRAVNQ